MAMIPEPATSAPGQRSRTWRRWLLIALLGVFGYVGWRQYDFREAIKEAKALGWRWYFDDPTEAIQKNWKAAFRKATWVDGRRALVITNAAELESHARLVRRLAPKFLVFEGGPQLKDLTALKGLSALRTLNLYPCTELPPTTTDDFAALWILKSLECSVGTGISTENDFPRLWALRLRGCSALMNLDALKGLPELQTLWLYGCTSLTAADIAALKAAMPKTKIDSSFLSPR